MTMPMKVAHAARLLKGTLHRGYTTVRDPAGGEIGLHLAISQGLMLVLRRQGTFPDGRSRRHAARRAHRQPFWLQRQ
jgi:hypothetical protein